MTRRSESAVVTEPAAEAKEPRVVRFRVGADEYVAFSFPAVEIGAPPALTASERCVFHALLAGQSNREIATGRARSHRTIANQVAAVFVKLGVGSRAELFARYGRQC